MVKIPLSRGQVAIVDDDDAECISQFGIATRSQNGQNKGCCANNTSGYKGVTYHVRNKKWCASIRVNGNRLYLGYRDTPEECAALYREAAENHHGEFARF